MAGFGRGVLRGATGGMGNLAAAIMRGPQTEQGAYGAEVLNQSKLAQALANIRQSHAAADKDIAESDLIANRPNLYREQAALSAGIDLPTLDAFGRKLAGMPADVPMGPPTAGGDMGVGSAQFSPELSSKIAQALQRNVPLIASGGAINPEQWAKSIGMFGDQDLRDRMISGQQAPLPVALAERAMKGGDAYKFDEFGVGNQFTGAVDTSNPAAVRFGDKRVAETGKEAALAGQARAAAAENYAQAGAAKARSAAAADGPKSAADKPRAGQMSVQLQKELIEADDTAQSAKSVIRTLKNAMKTNDGAYSGYFAKQRATLASNVPGLQSEAADATIELDNMMTGQALESLKVIFGAMPTEGERKVLLDMQASVDKTPAQRKAIMQRAIEAAERRAVYANNKALAIRNGKYLTEGIPEPAEQDGEHAPADSGGWSIRRVDW